MGYSVFLCSIVKGLHEKNFILTIPCIWSIETDHPKKYFSRLKNVLDKNQKCIRSLTCDRMR